MDHRGCRYDNDKSFKRWSLAEEIAELKTRILKDARLYCQIGSDQKPMTLSSMDYSGRISPEEVEARLRILELKKQEDRRIIDQAKEELREEDTDLADFLMERLKPELNRAVLRLFAWFAIVAVVIFSFGLCIGTMIK